MSTHLLKSPYAQVETSMQPAASTAFPLATDAAAEMLERGGNAVDAAVAAAWALAVCEPSASGLGGQTTLLLHTADGEFLCIDGHSYAPRKVSTQTVGPEQQRRGHRSCTIPSTAATLHYAHRKHGFLSWEDVLTPAIEIAERGYLLTPLQSKQIGWVKNHLAANPAASAVFLRHAVPRQPGDILRQPELAETLHLIAQSGSDIFYSGRLARDMADDMRENGGLMDERDLEEFSGPEEHAPISIRFRGVEVITIPSPGGGLQLLLALKVFERLLSCPAVASLEEWYSAVALATVAAFTARDESDLSSHDRAALFDEDYITELVRRLFSPAEKGAAAGDEPGETTHLTVADSDGNIVALTQSIQSVFGAKVANGRMGFVYNNYLHTCPRHSCRSQLGPNCVPRSNAAPVIVTQDTPDGKRPVLALGSAGSRRIISSLLQVISRIVDWQLPIQQAIDAPRIHGLLSRKLWIEKSIGNPAVVERLSKAFPEIVFKADNSFSMGAVHGLQFLPHHTLAAADPRRDGTGRVLHHAWMQQEQLRHGK